jgi:hypothetical protein
VEPGEVVGIGYTIGRVCGRRRLIACLTATGGVAACYKRVDQQAIDPLALDSHRLHIPGLYLLYKGAVRDLRHSPWNRAGDWGLKLAKDPEEQACDENK